MGTAAISWSAGKDSMLALILARETGLDVRTFYTMCEEDGASKGHALRPDVIEAQVTRLAGRWMGIRVPANTYPTVFIQTLMRLRDEGHESVVFGDIDLQAHRDWIEPACASIGLSAVFPLWGRPRAAVAAEVLRRAIRAVVVGVDTAHLDASFCGSVYDADFLRRLPDGVCPCGEGGEFHTFVFDAPGMSSPVPIRSGATRAVASQPPLRPTTLAFLDVSLLGESSSS